MADIKKILAEIDKPKEGNTEEVILYVPHEKQRIIVEDNHRFKVCCLGRQFGKTQFAIAELILKGLETPMGVFWYIAPYFAQAKDIAWARVKEMCSQLPRSAYKLNESELIVTFSNGATIKLMGAENPDRLRGAVLDGIVCDEFAFWTQGSAFPKVIRLALAKKGGFSWFISTPNGYNFFYDLFCLENVSPEEWKSFHYTSYDNPYLPLEEIENIKKTSSPLVFSQEVMAEFNKPEGAVWPNFSRKLHVIPKYRPDNNYPIYASIDFGFAIGHPTSFLLHEVHNQGITTFDGFLEEGLDPNQVVKKVLTYTKGLTLYQVYCDSARPDLIDLLKKSGIPATKASKDVELGIAKVDEFLKVDPITDRPRWQICGHLAKEIAQIESYRWQQVRTGEGKYKSVPVKEDDDSADSLRYFLYTHNLPNSDLRDKQKAILRQKLQESW